MASITAALRRVGFLLLVAAALSACDVSVGNGGVSLGLAAGRATDQWSRTYALDPGGEVEVINTNGTISVEATDRASVGVQAQREAKAPSDEAARELLGKIHIREDVAAGRVRIETQAPSGGLGSSHQVRYVVTVPRTARVALETSNGALKLKGLRGNARATNTNGGITGEALAGGVEARVTNGAIGLEFAAIGDAPIKVETVNGGVDVQLPAGARADVSARCVNGGVHLTGLDLEETGERTRRHVEGRLNGGGTRIDLETTNGGIRLTGKP